MGAFELVDSVQEAAIWEFGPAADGCGVCRGTAENGG